MYDPAKCSNHSLLLQDKKTYRLHKTEKRKKNAHLETITKHEHIKKFFLIITELVVSRPGLSLETIKTEFKDLGLETPDLGLGLCMHWS